MSDGMPSMTKLILPVTTGMSFVTISADAAVQTPVVTSMAVNAPRIFLFIFFSRAASKRFACSPLLC